MNLNNHTSFSFLHDSVLHDLRMEMGSDGDRCLFLSVTCNAETGYPEWNRKKLLIVARNVFLFQARFVGYTTDAEIIDAWEATLSKSAQAFSLQCQNSGLQIPPTHMQVTFHSGSSFDLVCADIAIKPVKQETLKSQVYDLYGLLFSKLEEARKAIEHLLDITFNAHTGDYMGGDYYQLYDSGRENFVLQRNFNSWDQDWQEPNHKKFPFLLYISETKRSDEIRARLTPHKCIRLLYHKVFEEA